MNRIAGMLIIGQVQSWYKNKYFLWFKLSMRIISSNYCLRTKLVHQWTIHVFYSRNLIHWFSQKWKGPYKNCRGPQNSHLRLWANLRSRFIFSTDGNSNSKRNIWLSDPPWAQFSFPVFDSKNVKKSQDLLFSSRFYEKVFSFLNRSSPKEVTKNTTIWRHNCTVQINLPQALQIYSEINPSGKDNW